MPGDAKRPAFTRDERDAYLAEEEKKLRVGERIQIQRNRARYVIDEDPDDPYPQPDLWWEEVEIIKILGPAPGGNLVFEVRTKGGTTRSTPLLTPWRRFSH